MPHIARDGFASVVALEVGMRSYGLLETSTRLGRDDHEQAMDLCGALRDFPPPRTVLDASKHIILVSIVVNHQM